MENKKIKKLIGEAAQKNDESKPSTINEEDIRCAFRVGLYRVFKIDSQTGFLSEFNFNCLKTPVANTSKEYILRNVVDINDDQIEVGLNSTEMCILAIRNDVDFSKSQVLFIATGEHRFIEKQNEFISNLKTRVEILQPNDCVHICVGSINPNSENPDQRYGHVADLCFYKNVNGEIGYFVYDSKGNPKISSKENNLTKDLCTIINRIIPKHNIDLNNKTSMDQAINSKYFSIGAQSNIGNCAINVVNFVKSFEDQRNTGINTVNILNSLTKKAVILFETAIGTENDTNLALTQASNFQEELLKPMIKTNVEEDEKNEYYKVTITGTEKFYYVPKERINYTFLPEGFKFQCVSCKDLLESVGVENIVINEFGNDRERTNIEIYDNETNYYIGDNKIDIEQLKK